MILKPAVNRPETQMPQTKAAYINARKPELRTASQNGGKNGTATSASSAATPVQKYASRPHSQECGAATDIGQEQHFLADARVFQADAAGTAWALACNPALGAVRLQLLVAEAEEMPELLMVDTDQLKRGCHANSLWVRHTGARPPAGLAGSGHAIRPGSGAARALQTHRCEQKAGALPQLSFMHAQALRLRAWRRVSAALPPIAERRTQTSGSENTTVEPRRR